MPPTPHSGGRRTSALSRPLALPDTQPPWWGEAGRGTHRACSGKRAPPARPPSSRPALPQTEPPCLRAPVRPSSPDPRIPLLPPPGAFSHTPRSAEPPKEPKPTRALPVVTDPGRCHNLPSCPGSAANVSARWRVHGLNCQAPGTTTALRATAETSQTAMQGGPGAGSVQGFPGGTPRGTAVTVRSECAALVLGRVREIRCPASSRTAESRAGGAARTPHRAPARRQANGRFLGCSRPATPDGLSPRHAAQRVSGPRGQPAEQPALEHLRHLQSKPGALGHRPLRPHPAPPRP